MSPKLRLDVLENTEVFPLPGIKLRLRGLPSLYLATMTTALSQRQVLICLFVNINAIVATWMNILGCLSTLGFLWPMQGLCEGEGIS